MLLAKKHIYSTHSNNNTNDANNGPLKKQNRKKRWKYFWWIQLLQNYSMAKTTRYFFFSFSFVGCEIECVFVCIYMSRFEGLFLPDLTREKKLVHPTFSVLWKSVFLATFWMLCSNDSLSLCVSHFLFRCFCFSTEKEEKKKCMYISIYFWMFAGNFGPHIHIYTHIEYTQNHSHRHIYIFAF